MKLYNTLSRLVEEFQPIAAPSVGFYACGFTVYDYTHLGHLRKYTMDDVLIRTLRRAGYQVKFVQNVTDVGHLSSDADTGEDKLEKGAKKYNKSVWDIAKEFEAYFFYSMDKMGNLRPDISCRATDHIPAQIALVQTLEQKGFTYIIENDGVYFDTSKISDYGKLAGFDPKQLMEGARVEAVPGKKNPTDFALWKFERSGENRAMVWESPWGKRTFPGWHIECSAMAMEYLGEQFDVHTGGIDHIPVHHTNEIAQAEAATGKVPFVRYWVHHNHLHVDGTKMSKSLGNFFTIDDVIKKNINPMALRLLFLSTHYRSEMNFTWDNVVGAQTAWSSLSSKITQFKHDTDRVALSEEKVNQIAEYRQRFFSYIEDDLRTPEAVAVMWEVLKSNVPSIDKYDLLVEFDTVLGLGLSNLASTDTVEIKKEELAPEVQQLLDQREQARLTKNWDESDRLREQIARFGYQVLDAAGGVKIKKLG
ncbi:MAG: cysteine--tRNA ligase [Patescibacteria group bacterium]